MEFTMLVLQRRRDEWVDLFGPDRKLIGSVTITDVPIAKIGFEFPAGYVWMRRDAAGKTVIPDDEMYQRDGMGNKSGRQQLHRQVGSQTPIGNPD